MLLCFAIGPLCPFTSLIQKMLSRNRLYPMWNSMRKYCTSRTLAASWHHPGTWFTMMRHGCPPTRIFASFTQRSPARCFFCPLYLPALAVSFRVMCFLWNLPGRAHSLHYHTLALPECEAKGQWHLRMRLYLLAVTVSWATFAPSPLLLIDHRASLGALSGQ
jgi:hypothetical protein